MGAAAFFGAANLPFFFLYGIGFKFLHAEVSGYIISQMYTYDWIPLYSIAALTIVEIITAVGNQRIRFSFPVIQKGEDLRTDTKPIKME
jgi:hypothetical protein